MARGIVKKIRLLLIIGFIYIAYQWINDTPQTVPIVDLTSINTNQTSSNINQTLPTDIQHSFFLFSIFSFFFSIIRTIFSWIGALISFLWNTIWSIWTIFMIGLNGVFTFASYQLGKRKSRSTIEFFFGSFAVVVLLPTIINRLLVSQVVAYNIMLPIYVTSFVDINANYRAASPTIIRNFVFFVFIAALL